MKFLSTKAFLLLWLSLIFETSTSQRVTPLLVPHEREANLQPITWNCVKRVEASKKWKYFQSRGYPKLLNVKESRCSWKIVTAKGSRIKLAFRGMDLFADDPKHCSANYIEVIDETLKKSQARFCGKAIPGDIVSHGNKIRVDFQAQSGIDTTTKGFSIGYATTGDQSGFYQHQTFSKRASPRPSRAPRRPSPSIIIDTDADKSRKSSDDAASTSIEAIIGTIIAIVAVAIIGFLLWSKREKIKSSFRGDESKTASSSLDTYPAPPQNKIDPFERIMSVVEPYPSPPSVVSTFTEDMRSTYVNCQAPPVPHKNRDLPGFKNNFKTYDENMPLGSSSKNHENVWSVSGSIIPPACTPLRTGIEHHLSKSRRPKCASQQSDVSHFSPSGVGSYNETLKYSEDYKGDTMGSHGRDQANRPPPPPRSSRSSTLGFSRNHFQRRRENDSDFPRNMSTVHEGNMEGEKKERHRSRMSDVSWAQSKTSHRSHFTNQVPPRHKIYLPDKPLPDIPPEQGPPPLPPKKRSILLTHEDECPKPWLERAPSRCLSRLTSRSTSNLPNFEDLPRTLPKSRSDFSGVRPRRRSFSEMSSYGKFANTNDLPVSQDFNRNSRMRATVGSRAFEPQREAQEPPLPPREGLGRRSTSRRSMRSQSTLFGDDRHGPILPPRIASSLACNERDFISY